MKWYSTYVVEHQSLKSRFIRQQCEHQRAHIRARWLPFLLVVPVLSCKSARAWNKGIEISTTVVVSQRGTQCNTAVSSVHTAVDMSRQKGGLGQQEFALHSRSEFVDGLAICGLFVVQRVSRSPCETHAPELSLYVIHSLYSLCFTRPMCTHNS